MEFGSPALRNVNAKIDDNREKQDSRNKGNAFAQICRLPDPLQRAE